jgi:hypothetical protein
MKNFRSLLQQNASLPIYAQYQSIKQTFGEWKGNQEQTDDVCVLGIRYE